MRFLFLIGVLVVAACSSGNELAKPHGEWFQLNPTYWTAQRGDLRGPEGYK